MKSTDIEHSIQSQPLILSVLPRWLRPIQVIYTGNPRTHQSAYTISLNPHKPTQSRYHNYYHNRDGNVRHTGRIGNLPKVHKGSNNKARIWTLFHCAPMFPCLGGSQYGGKGKLKKSEKSKNQWMFSRESSKYQILLVNGLRTCISVHKGLEAAQTKATHAA